MARKWKNYIFLGNWGLGKKLILMYSLMIILPVLVVTLLGFQRYNDNLTEKVGNFSDDLIDQLSTNIDTYLNQISNLSLSFYLNDGVKELIGSENASTPNVEYQKKITIDRVLRNLLVMTSLQDILGAYWISDNGTMYSQYGSGLQIDYSKFNETAEYQKVLNADGKGVLLPTRRILTGTSNDFAYSYARSIIDAPRKNSVGVLMIDISLNELGKMIQASGKASLGVKVIVDADNNLIYHPDYNLIGQPFSLNLLDKQRDNFITDYLGTQTMVSYIRSSYSDWTIVNLIPMNELTQQLNIITKLLWTLAGVTLLLSISLSAALTSSIIKPLKKMRTLIQRVEKGDYTVQFDSPAKDEVGQVGRSFNVMVQTINELVNHNLTMKILKQQAEFKALQSQINPHFLFNTLESINMKAEINGDYETAEMISLLGKLFRMSMKPSGELIHLSREIEYVRVYVNLQQKRFPKLIFEINLSQEALEASIPPWVIQPLVENAIVHGLKAYRGEGLIRITDVTHQDDIIIQVTDNGKGVTSERLNEIEQILQADTFSNEDYIGLKNVHDRILYFYGSGYGLSIESTLDQGTTITIRIKKTNTRENIHEK